MKIVHAWLKDYLGEDIPLPEKVEALLTFHSFEVEARESVGEHVVLDVDVLPNRSSDCLSHRGMARELGSILDRPLTFDPFTEEITMPTTDRLVTTIEHTHACRRFGLALMTGVQVGESPAWLRTRLEALGQRSINNIVDATNYVMLAVGQPLHAYDAKKFVAHNDAWHFSVRFGKKDERVRTLSGEEYELDDRVQVIVNATDGSVAGIAGIKGGTYAQVGDETTAIILEAANFDPVVTRRSSQHLRLQTDASKRFENEPSPALVPYALQEVTKLIAAIGGGTLVGWHDLYPKARIPHSVEVRTERVNGLLGLSLSTDEIIAILRRIGCVVSDEGEQLTVRPPWERTDLLIEEDYIEEVGRLYGYEHIASVVPTPVPLGEYNARHYYSEQVRSVLLERGFSEVITSSFRKKDRVRLQNALASDKGYLRSTLRKNIDEVLNKNIPFVDLLGVRDIRVFEIGTVFTKENVLDEHVSLTLGVRTKSSGPTQKDDHIVGEAITAIENVLGVKLTPVTERGIVEINFSELLTQLPQPNHYVPVGQGEDVHYQPFSPYPSMSRDIALFVSEGVEAREVAGILRDTAGPLCVRVTLFDEFQRDKKTSYAFRLVFQSHEKTLTDTAVNTIMEQIYGRIEENGWEVR